MRFLHAGIAFSLMNAAAVCAQDQAPPGPAPTPTNPGQAGPPPNTPADRVWYPKADVIKPDEILGLVIFVDDKQVLHPVEGPLVKSTYKPDLELLKVDPAWSFSRTKKQSAEGSVPLIALSVKLEDDQSESGSIIDVAHQVIPRRDQYSFCEIWPLIRYKWQWKEGDLVQYIFRATVSTVSWKIGKEHGASAGFAVGDYFSLGGKQYDQQSTSAVVSATSYDTIDAMVTKDSLKGKCPIIRPLNMVKSLKAVMHPISVAKRP